MKQNEYKSAFTLSEVLLVLTVIGLVAALTIPTLIQKVSNDQYAVKLKKEYSALSQAINTISAENMGIENLNVWTPDSQQINIMNLLATKLNIIKNCGTAAGCMYSGTYKYLSGNAASTFDNDSSTAKAVLADGSSIMVGDKPGSCSDDQGDNGLNYTCGYIDVDVNGPAPPNQIGRDFFVLFITKDGLILDGTNGRYTGFSDCNSSGAGWSCPGKIMTEGAMNY